MRALGTALAVAALLLAALPVAAAGQECPRTTLAAVEAEVMCPVCGTPLGLATEAPQAERQRALIQRLVERCRSKDEIKDVLVAQYGPNVLALPEPEGFKLGVYLFPALALLLAAGGLTVAVRRWRTRGEGTADPTAPAAADPAAADPVAGERLEADLRRYDL